MCRGQTTTLTRAIATVATFTTVFATTLATTASTSHAATDPVKRATPNYDGRGPEPTTVGEDMLWVPRILMAPLYFVSEYVVRKPLMFLLTEAERAELLSLDAVTFGNGNIGIVPTLLLDFGLEVGMLPSGGIYFWWDNFIVPNNDLRFRAAFGGEDWIELTLRDTVTFGDDDQFELYIRGEWSRRRDSLFAGIGPRSGPVARFGQNELQASLGFSWQITSRSFLDLELSLDNIDFFRGGCCEEPSVEQLVDDGTLPGLPPGYNADGIWAFKADLRAAWDTRNRRPEDESGFRAEVRGGIAANLRKAGTGWGHYGATLGGFIDIWEARTLGLILQVDFAQSFGGVPVPFTDLAMLGGEGHMSGYVDGRLRGESSIVLGLDYRWPIWFWLDGWLYASVGNVFGKHLEDFEFGLLRASFGFGVRTSSEEDHPFTMIIAAGTEPLADGAAITNVRFVLGTSSGF